LYVYTNSTKMAEEINVKKYKRIILAESILIVVLIILLIISLINTRTVIVNSDKTTSEKLHLQSELDSLLAQHQAIKTSYGALSDSLSTKDSVIQQNAKEIRNLLAIQYDYGKVKRKLDLLRKITQNYVRQIDSLYQVNEMLTQENVKIKNDLSHEKDKTRDLTKNNDSLTRQVNQAALLKAYNVVTKGIHLRAGGKKEEETEKARKTDKVKICFTLSENKLTHAGTKTIYIRIARPDNQIITKGNEDIYSFIYQGQKIQYSIKKIIDYQNSTMNMCVYWEKADKEKEAMKGVYHVSVFCDDYEIGQSSFELK
jgi:hypothetical protein